MYGGGGDIRVIVLELHIDHPSSSLRINAAYPIYFRPRDLRALIHGHIQLRPLSTRLCKPMHCTQQWTVEQYRTQAQFSSISPDPGDANTNAQTHARWKCKIPKPHSSNSDPTSLATNPSPIHIIQEFASSIQKSSASPRPP
jgi:hypothetical protein